VLRHLNHGIALQDQTNSHLKKNTYFSSSFCRAFGHFLFAQCLMACLVGSIAAQLADVVGPKPTQASASRLNVF
jgi:hypothetical protein